MAEGSNQMAEGSNQMAEGSNQITITIRNEGKAATIKVEMSKDRETEVTVIEQRVSKFYFININTLMLYVHSYGTNHYYVYRINLVTRQTLTPTTMKSTQIRPSLKLKARVKVTICQMKKRVMIRMKRLHTTWTLTTKVLHRRVSQAQDVVSTTHQRGGKKHLRRESCELGAIELVTACVWFGFDITF